MNILNTKNWRVGFLTILMVLMGFVCTHLVFAAAFNDAATGNWNIGTTWGGACAGSCTEGTDYPGPNDTATVDSHTVTLTADHSVIDLTIASGGTLSAGANRLIILGGWSNTGGTFTASTSTVLFTSTTAENIDPDNDAFNDFIINDGLIIYMKFDETSANTCSGGTNDSCDSSGFGKDGAWAGTTASNASIPSLNFINNRSVDLDGNSDYISISNPNLSTGDFTYAAWINVDSTSDEMIVMSPTSGGGNELIFRVSGGGLNTFTNGSSRVNSALSISLNTWTHVAVTRTGSTIRQFVNGVLDTNTGSDGGTFNFGGCPVYIGTDIDSGCAANFGNYYDGQIDDWRAYNRALSTAEILQLANGNVPSSASGTFTLQDNLDVNGDMYINSGELDVDASNDYDINLAGDWYNFGGVFTAQQGTVIFDGGDQSILTDETFYNVQKIVAATSTITFAESSTTTINGTLKLEGAAGQLLGLESTNSGTRFELDIKSMDQIVNYVSVKDSEASTNNVVAVNSTNAGGNDDGEAVPHWDFNLPVSIGGTVYTDEGTTNIGSGITVAISINGAAATATDDTDGSGVYAFTGISTVPGDILTIYIDGETEKAVAVIKVSVGALTDVDLYEDHLIVRSESSSALTNTNLATADNNGDADITGAYSISSGNLTVSAGYDLYVWPGDNAFTPGGTVTTPDLDIYGNFDIENNNLTVSSTLINGDGGTLDLGGGQTLSTSTVNMNTGSNVIYRGDDDAGADTITLTTLSSTYYNLTINSADGVTDEFELGAALTVNGTLDVTAGTFDFNTNDADITSDWLMRTGSQNVVAGLAGIDVTVGGDMTLTGESGDVLTMNVGSGWTLDVTGVGTASYVNVSNSDASAGSEIIAFDGTNTDSGGNMNWNFAGADISGTVYTDEGTTDIGSGRTVAVSINGAAAAGTDDTDVNGDYLIPSLNFQAGDILTLYVDGEAEQAVTVIEAKAGTNSGIDLYEDRLIIRQENSGSMTNADLATADNNADTDITDFYSMSANVLTMASDIELFIWTGTTYAPGDTTIVDDIDIDGTFTMGSDSIFVEGSWDATGGTYTSTSQVMFRSTNSETITSNGQSFDDFTINDGLIGYWKFDEGSGTTAVDSSGYGYDGTYVNIDAGDWVDPVPVNFYNTFGLDINTTSTNEYVSLPNTVIDGLGNITAAFWMKTTRTGQMGMISGANGSSNNEYLIFFSNDTTMNLYFGGSLVSWSIASIADGAWHHIVVVRDDTNNEALLYVDGVGDDENPEAFTLSTVTIDPGGLIVAQEQDSVGGGFQTSQIYDGTLDDLRLYNRVLTAAEVATLANGNTSYTGLGSFVLQDNLNVNGTLAIHSGELDVNSLSGRDIHVEGNWHNFGGVFTNANSTVIFDGDSGTSEIIPSGQSFYNVIVDDGNGGGNLNVLMRESLDVENDLTVTEGVLDLDGHETFVDGDVVINDSLDASSGTDDNTSIFVQGSWDMTGATFTNTDSTVVFVGTTSQTITSNTRSFNNLTFNDGLVAYWPLDENVSPALDVSGNKHHGVWVNNTALNTSVSGTINFANSGSTEFDGTNDYIEIPDSDDLDLIGGEFTLAAWVFPDDYGQNSQGRIIDKDGNAGAVDGWSFLLDDNLVADGITVYINNVANSSNAGIILTSQWQHVAVTLSGGTLTYYVNGIAEGTDGSVATPIANTTVVRLGMQSSDLNRDFDGLIDDVRIYERALSATEMLNLAQGDMPGINRASYTLQDNLDVNGTLLINAGELNTGSDRDININSHWLNHGGVFTANNGQVTFDGTASGLRIISGSQAFYDVDMNGAGGEWSLQDDMTVLNLLDVSNGTLTYTSEVNVEPVTVIGTMSLSGGTFSGNTERFRHEGSLEITTGTYTAPSNVLELDQSFTHSGGTFTNSSGTVMLTGTTSETVDTTGGGIFNDVIVNSGLIAYWRLDEAATPAYDSSGYDHDGIWTGATTDASVSGSFRFENSASVDFDGSNDYIEIQDSDELDLTTGAFTLSAWISPDNFGQNLEGRILDKNGETSDDDGWSWMIDDNGISDAMTMFINNTEINSNATVINTGQWQHVAVTLSNGQLDFYVDGSNVGTTNSVATPGANDSVLRIGIRASDTNRDFNGQMDDIRIYDRALTAQELERLRMGYQPAISMGEYTLQTNLDVDGTMSLNAGTLNVSINDRIINVGAGWMNQGGVFNAQSGTVIFDGLTSSYQIVSAEQTFYNVQFDDGNGGGDISWILRDSLDVDGTLQISEGTLDISASNYDVLTAGSWRNSGSFVPRTGTVYFDGATTQVIETCDGCVAGDFINIVVSNNGATVNFLDSFSVVDFTGTFGGTSLTFEAGTTITITDTLNLNGQSVGTKIFLNSSDGTNRFEFDVATDQNVSFVNVSNSEASTSDIFTTQSSRGANTDSPEPSPHWVLGPLKGAIIIVD